MSDDSPPEDDGGEAVRLERPRAHKVDSLPIEKLPKGEITRLLVKLTHDGMGTPIRVPVLAARGERPGPVFGITAAVHGNELNGIPVIHQLFRRLQSEKLRGTVVAVVVTNVPAYLRHQRRFDEGIDLNHIMPGRSDGNSAEVYVHRFIERIGRHFNFLLDLHTASFGRINSLYVRADMTHPVASQMAYLQRPQIIVHNPASDRTLRGTAMELGIPAITVEISNPHRFQPEYIRRSLVGLRAVLAELGLLRKRPVAMGSSPILCERSYWLYTDHGGLLDVMPDVTQYLQQGDTVARISNIFGDPVREYQTPESGVVIGKSVDPVSQTGARILHLGIPAASKEAFRDSAKGAGAPRPPPADDEE